MNNYELHSRAHELASSHSGYNLARRLLALEEEFKEYRDSASAVPYWLADIASQLYQACGAYDMPDRVMDVLSDLQGGKRPKSVDILPVHPTAPAAVPDDHTLVPNSALRWLFGEEGDFVPPEAHEGHKPSSVYKKRGKYWWRSVFRELIADAQEDPT